MCFDDIGFRYKPPLGAARAGEPVTFRVEARAGCTAAALAVFADGQDDRPAVYPMTPTDTGFAVTHVFPRAGLYFYFCQFTLPDGSAGAGERLQLTVYAADYVQPQGWAGGVMYQIFPDRFAIGSGGVLPTPFPDRVLHDDLTEPPAFRPDGTGRIRNNDYYGGNLRGIEEKIPYLRELGVSCIYLNPIGEAHSNHRYDTADYMRVDPLLGDETDFRRLCAVAHGAGIRVILDGVYSHTGADSVYFNKYGRYPEPGAYQSERSDYIGWYTFPSYPDRYKSWWGFDTLPEINEHNPTFIEFICGEGGVIDYWMSLGADGLRLDVADELPDAFIEKIRQAVKRHGNDRLLIGEVWEDASNKISYGERRRYLLGGELDAVMNYPFRAAILDFVRDGRATRFMERVGEIAGHYPKPMLHLMMNMLSTHDTERAVSVLAAGGANGHSREWQAARSLDFDEYLRGVEMLKLAMVLQFTLPGIPCIYYGDEIGMQGMRDPFNRGFMRWDAVDRSLLGFTRSLSAVRRSHPAFADGDFLPLIAEESVVAFLRRAERETVMVALNRSDSRRTIPRPDGSEMTLEPWQFEIAAL